MADLTAKRKGIILMHDIQPSTAGAIMGLLDELHAKGFKVVHIVPKAPATAVAGYNSAVDKAFAEKSAATAANPMANRSVVWSMAPAAAAGASSGAPKGADGTSAPPAAVASAAQSAAAGSEELPWLKPKAAADAKPAAPKPQPRKPARAPSDDLPWVPKVFGF